jgi:hypothetical protein
MDSLNDSSLLVRQMDVTNNWLTTNGTGSFHVKSKLIPRSLLEIAPHLSSGQQTDLFVERPSLIRESVFLEYPKENSHWGYCLDNQRLYAGSSAYQKEHTTPQNHRFQVVTKRSASYPFCFYDIQFRTSTLPAEGQIKKVQLKEFDRGRLLGPFEKIFTEVYFGNADTGEYLDVSKVSIGSTCSIALRDGTFVEDVYGFGKGGKDIGLGYQMTTDGSQFFLSSGLIQLDELKKTPALYNTLKHNIFRFEILKESKKPGGEGLFTVAPFLDAFLVWIDELGGYDNAKKFFDSGPVSPNGLQRFNEVVARFFMLGERTKAKVLTLLKSQPFMTRVLEGYESIVREKDQSLLKGYFEDILVHSLKHALKSSFTILGGFESERDLSGWTYLNYDFKHIGEKQIFLFEHGMYGTGSMLSVFSRFKRNPRVLWNVLESYSTGCPTGDEEDFLGQVLTAGKENTGWVHQAIVKIKETNSERKRRKELTDFQSAFRKRFGLEIGEEHVKSLYRVFSEPYELGGKTIDNWALYRELVDLYEGLRSHLQRNPSTFEVQEKVFKVIIQNKPNPEIENWLRLFEVLKGRTDSPYDLRLRQIQSAIAQMDDLRNYIRACTEQDLDKIAGETYDEQVSDVISKLGFQAGNDDSVGRSRLVIETLFDLVEGVSLHGLFKQISLGAGINALTESKARDLLTKRQLKEEVDKRLLNTCVDSCPSCLEAPCEIDTMLRSRMLLSRRLLAKVVESVKSSLALRPDDLTEEQFYTKVKEKLASGFEAYLHYSSNQSVLIGKVVGRLIGDNVKSDGKQFTVEVNYSRARNISSEGLPEFEALLLCKES